MKKITHFNTIEKFVYDNSSARPIRFVNYTPQNNNTFYYDCLLGESVSLKKDKITHWNNGTMLSTFFPFCDYNNIDVKKQPPFQKQAWEQAVTNAKKMILLLEEFKKNITNSIISHLDSDIENIIDNIRTFFNISIDLETSQQSCELDNSILNLYEKLDSPKLFHQINFLDKHKNPIYLLLEKIFAHFNTLSKYQMTHTYVQVKNIDAYLLNHIKNIVFSQHFASINIETETISILEKINIYLTTIIDQHLEECINNQLQIMDSIQQKFTITNKVS